MSGFGPYRASDILKFPDAAEIYAQRDRRRGDDDRSARDRAKKAIKYAIKGGRLLPASEDGRSFRRDFFVFWAASSEPRSKNIEWDGDFAGVKWSERFEGLYQAEPPVVRGFDFECDFTYPEWSLLEPIPEPTAEAPQEWVKVLAFSRFQNDALRKRIAELEGEVTHLKRALAGMKGGLSKGL